jgi:tRNA-guanine family transglycosylase
MKMELTTETSFEIQATAGAARSGALTVRRSTMETPNLFPVINFYAGGTKNSVYGGGIHRTIKEFMTGEEAVNGIDCSEYFDGVMMSVASLTDYNLNKERFESYLSTPIKQREVFENFEGLIFVDSGGFKVLNNGKIEGKQFEMDFDQRTAFDIQQKLGGDIIVNLDHPITPDDTFETRKKKAKQTAENAAEFIRLSSGNTASRYLTLHGYNYSMIDTFLEELKTVLGTEIGQSAFDGIALGSLVPLKDNKQKLVTAVQDCQQVLADHGYDDFPLHVLGISGTSIPLLAALGVDSFDSSSYLHAAINGKYYTSISSSVNIDEADFSRCGCKVCSNADMVERMTGNAEYQKDILGPVAMHNLILQKRELRKIRSRIRQRGADGMIKYLDKTLARDDRTRKVTHRVVNEALGGYF